MKSNKFGNLSIDILTNDPLGTVLFKHLRIKPIYFFIIGLISAIFVHLIIGNTISITLFPIQPDQPIHIINWHEVLQEFILVPFLWYYYAWMPRGINHTFNSLWRNGVFASSYKYQDFLNDFFKVFSYSKYIPYLTIIILILTFSTEIPYWLTWSIAKSESSYIYYFTYGIHMGLSWYFVITMSLREILVISLLKRVFDRREICIYLWHPDKVGGFSPLGKYRLNIAIILAIMATILVIVSFPSIYKSDTPSNSISPIALLYLIIGPIVFIYPLLEVHKAMNLAKKKYLLDLSKKLNSYKNYIRRNSHRNKYKVPVNFDFLVQLYKIATTYPVWPVDISTIGRFIFVTILPSLLNLIGLIL